MRTTQLDADNRRSPKTDRFCCRCHKDIAEGAACRIVHVVSFGAQVLHPDDSVAYQGADDLGAFRIGLDCAKKIGLEFSTPE